MPKIYITGDTHRNFKRIQSFCYKAQTNREDILIILGDAGINYYLDSSDKPLKKKLSKLPITLFCIHGNHEERPENIPTYHETEFYGGKVYIEDEYSNLIFAKDGEIYNLNGNRCLVLGGAYSVDKYYRLATGNKWFPSEQITDRVKGEIENFLDTQNWSVDYVLSHTCPYHTRPTHLFLKCINQDEVDSSMEVWLQKIADRLNFKHWYFGHFHDDWDNGKYSMLYTDIVEFPMEDNI